jgi:dipeptidyl aminopeptidase/acylaminoacyl peptidase
MLATSSLTAFAADGTGPDDAQALPNDWQPLEKGDEVWYGFFYDGDGSEIRIRMEAVPLEGGDPPQGVNFQVWTPEEARRWRAGSEVEPIGRGSKDPAAPGALLWKGAFNDKGTYYVVVESTGSQPGTTYYDLAVSGSGVSTSAPAPGTRQTSPADEAVPVRAAAPAKASGKLAFQTGIGGEIYSINADGSALTRITTGMDPTWAPGDSGYAGLIAFNRWEEPRGVWVVDTNNGNEWRVFDWSQPRWTSWSPDGSDIMFSRVTSGRQEPREFCFRGFCFAFPATPHWKMGVVATDGSDFYEPHPPESQTSRAPEWSPDGQRVVFADIQGLRVQTLDGKTSYQITNDSRDTSPTWSPDGKQIAFIRRQHDHWEIYVVNEDGSNLRPLTSTPAKPNGEVGDSASPAWSPEGQFIAFLTDRTGQWEIWNMRANGTSQQPMFATALDSLTLDYAWQGERAISWTE